MKLSKIVEQDTEFDRKGNMRFLTTSGWEDGPAYALWKWTERGLTEVNRA